VDIHFLKKTLDDWFKKEGGSRAPCPLCNQNTEYDSIVPNYKLREAIVKYLNFQNGVTEPSVPSSPVFATPPQSRSASASPAAADPIGVEDASLDPPESGIWKGTMTLSSDNKPADILILFNFDLNAGTVTGNGKDSYGSFSVTGTWSKRNGIDFQRERGPDGNKLTYKGARRDEENVLTGYMEGEDRNVTGTWILKAKAHY